MQGGGGNTSVKDGKGSMYVKASGTPLGEMKEGVGYRLVDVERCLAMLDDADLMAMPSAEQSAEVLRRLMACCLDEAEGRPSVETTLHALLGRCVVHTHPSVIGGVLCANEGPEAVASIFADSDPPVLYVPYCHPGYRLAVRVGEALAEYRAERGREPQVVLLENHGLFVSAGDVDSALKLTKRTFETVERAWRARSHVAGAAEHKESRFRPDEERDLIAEACAALRATYCDLFEQPVLVRFSIGGPVKLILSRHDVAQLVATDPLDPDQLVYCRGPALWVAMPPEGKGLRERIEEVVQDNATGPTTPTCVLVESLGLFAVGASPKLLESALCTMEAVLQMLVVAAVFDGPRPLTPEAAEEIRNWEVEHYRRGLFAGGEARSPLAGRVAVVTGAGSGLGRGISLGLAKKGVNVVLADIDLDAARQTARRIEVEGATGTGVPAKVDVTGEQAVKDLFQYVTAYLGGADVLVNCAGIGPVFPLTEFPLDVWRKALDINLTGYFLMGREAARVMVRQGTGGNIINLSSKTGLHPSKHHSAYNATKAADIHMARGWALDLAEYGVRVNVVCPGNVFKESKIWSEDYIKALAEKRGIEPEEVIPYYINLTALKKDIEWDDIAEAVAFLISPSASKITGQTLVVDAGQVFVR